MRKTTITITLALAVAASTANAKHLGKPEDPNYEVFRPEEGLEHLPDLLKKAANNGRFTAYWLYIMQMASAACGYRINETLTVMKVNQMLYGHTAGAGYIEPTLKRLQRLKTPMDSGDWAIMEFAEALRYDRDKTCAIALELWGPDGKHIDHLMEEK